MKIPKQDRRYRIVSIRVSDEERAYVEELSRRDRTTVSNVMRHAMRVYVSHLLVLQEQRRANMASARRDSH